MVPRYVAAVTLDVDPFWVLTGAMVAVLVVLLSAAAHIATIYKVARKSPPDHVVYATKKELEVARQAAKTDLAVVQNQVVATERRLERILDHGLARLNARFEDFQGAVNKELQSISRSLGRLEARPSPEKK